MTSSKLLYIFGLLIILSISVSGAGNDSTTTPPENPTTGKHTTKPVHTTKHKDVTTTPAPTVEQICASLNSSCKSCVGNAKCLWCNSGNKCVPYPGGKVLPPSSVCALDHARWGVCWVNFKVLIIVLGSIGGALLLALTICICCCCCKRKNSSRYDKEDAKLERRKMERKAKNDEKRAERRAKTDEIRRKYGIEIKGLIKDDNPYQRFDDA